MALTTKRIIALPAQTEPQEGDYLAIDNAQGGTHKIPVGSVGVEVDDTLTEQGKAADAKAVGDAIDALRSQIEVTGTASGAIATFTDGSDAPMKSCMVTIVPKQSGSGTPSPDNVRPISGWESVNVYKRGVNLWDEEWEVGSINDSTGEDQASSTRIRSKGYISALPNTTYFFHCSHTTPYWNVYEYDSNKAFIGRKVLGRDSEFTTDSDVDYIRFRENETNYGTTYNHDISINYPSTDHDYHAYNGTTTTTSLGRTVYGADAEIVGGSLTDKMGIVDLGTLNWNYYDYYGHSGGYSNGINQLTKLYPSMSTAPNAISNKLRTVSDTIFNSSDGNTGSDITINSAGTVKVTMPNCTDSASLKTALNGVMLVYELAEPQTYTLTPSEVKTLLGKNNVWADSGDVEVVYVRDLNIAINNLLNSNGTRSLGMMAMSAPTEATAEEPTDEQSDEQTEEPAEDDMR